MRYPIFAENSYYMNMKSVFMAMSILVICGMMTACEGQKDPQGEPYWLGADISFARSQEARGVQYKNKAGEPRECTALMKELGLNAISLRVWVGSNPRMRPGQQVTDPTDPAWHIGRCDKEDVLAKALLAKEQGMEILLSFHYSDSWSDPKSQPIPYAWRNHNYAQMLQDVRDHTTEVLQYLKDHGITPRWAKIGNETANGILWNGKDRVPIPEESMGHLELNPEQYAGFIDAGAKAAKSIFPDIITMVHLDSGFDRDLYDRNLGVLEKYGANYDQVAMSLYPYWAAQEHGMTDGDQIVTDCIENIKHVWERFGKETLIVETGFLNEPANAETLEEGYHLLKRLLQEGRYGTEGHCKGVFYWEPESMPGGYQLGAFDSDAKPTLVMDAFRDYVAPVSD